MASKNFFKEEVAPWLDEVPDDYILILTNAIAVSLGRDHLAPDIEHLQKEVKELTVYIANRASKIAEKKNAKVSGPTKRSLN